MKCNECKTERPPDAFYASNKHKCKSCVIKRVKAYRAENLDRILAYDKARGMRPDRVEMRYTYIRTERGKKAHNRATRKYYYTRHDRRVAHVALGNAIRDGRVIPWPVCAVPDCNHTKVEGHHPDYGRPLDVVWLCTPHHKQAHALVRGL